LARPVFYDLVEHGEERTEGGRRMLGIWSNGLFFRLGALDAPASGDGA
jgi:hypothetical protein